MSLPVPGSAPPHMKHTTCSMSTPSSASSAAAETRLAASGPRDGSVGSRKRKQRLISCTKHERESQFWLHLLENKIRKTCFALLAWARPRSSSCKIQVRTQSKAQSLQVCSEQKSHHNNLRWLDLSAARSLPTLMCVGIVQCIQISDKNLYQIKNAKISDNIIYVTLDLRVWT